MGSNPVIPSFAYLLAHAPELVRYGSRPFREIGSRPEASQEIAAHLRGFEKALAYAPNQVFLGRLSPEELAAWPEPWWQHPVEDASRAAPFGPFLDQTELYAFLKAVDQFDLVWFTPGFTERLAARLKEHPLALPGDLGNLGAGHSRDEITERMVHENSLPLFEEGELVGAIHRAHDDDEALQAGVLLENLAAKATGTAAVRALLERAGIDTM